MRASFSDFMICCGLVIASCRAKASAQSAVLFAGHYITPVEWYKAGVSQPDEFAESHETVMRACEFYVSLAWKKLAPGWLCFHARLLHRMARSRCHPQE